MSTEREGVYQSLIEKLTIEPGKAADLEFCLDRVLTTAASLLTTPPDLCAITAINPVTERFLFHLAYEGSTRADRPKARAAPLPDDNTFRALRDGILTLSDVAAYPDYQTDFTHAHGVAASLIVPIVDRGAGRPDRQLAVIYLDYRSPQQFSSEEQRDLSLLADLAARLVLRQAWALHRYAEVSRIGSASSVGLTTIEALFRNIYQQSSTILDLRHVFMLSAYNRRNGSFDIYLFQDGVFQSFPDDPLDGYSRHVLDTRQEIFITDLARESADLPGLPKAVRGSELLERSAIFVPLISDEQTTGVLSIQSTVPAAFDAIDVQVLRLLASQVAPALSNIRLVNDLQQLNDAGQELTNQLTDPNLMQVVVGRIVTTGQADLATIYTYDESAGFSLPPYRGGDFREPGYTERIDSPEDHMANMLFRYGAPVFASDSRALFAMLGGDPDQRRGSFEQREAVESTAALPLRVGSLVMGVLFVGYRRRQEFGPAQRQLLENLASFAAIGIGNARRFVAMAGQHERELEILREIDRRLSQSIDLNDTLQAILDLAISRVPRVDKAAIFLYHPAGRFLEIVALHPLDNSRVGYRLALSAGLGLTSYAFRERKAVRVGNVLSEEPWKSFYVQVNPETRSELDAPMLQGDEIIGVVNFESNSENAFSAEDERFVVVLAGQALLAIRNAQNYEAQRRLADERAGLMQIGEQLVRAEQLDPIFDRILERALAITRSNFGTLMLGDGDQVRIGAQRGVTLAPPDASHSLEQGIVGKAVREKRTINAGDVQEDEWKADYLAYIAEMRAELAVPLIDGDTVRGVLNIESPEPYHFSSQDESLVQGLASLAVIAMQNIERFAQAESRQAQLRHLHYIDAQIIRTSGSVVDVIRTIVLSARTLTRAGEADLHLYEGGSVTATYITPYADPDDAAEVHLIHPETERSDEIARSIISEVARTRRPYRTSGDAQDDPLFVGNSRTRSELAVPLMSGDGPLVGVLNVESASLNAFGDEEQELLELLADAAVIALINARSYQGFQLLEQVGRELAAIADPERVDDAYAIIQRAALTALPGSQVVIRRYNPKRRELRVVSYVPDHAIGPPDALSVDEGLHSVVFTRRKSLLVPDLNNLDSELPPHRLPAEQGSWFCAPIFSETLYYGHLAITMSEPNRLMDIDRTLFEGLAQQLATTLQRLDTAHARRAAEQRIRDTDTFLLLNMRLADVVHRIGNGLGFIPATINAIRRDLGKNGSSQPEIEQRLARIEGPVNQILELSRTLRQESQPTAIPVGELLLKAVTSVNADHTRYAIVIDSPDQPLYLRAVPAHASEIIYNLMRNAIEAMAGAGKVSVRVELEEEFVRIEVRDTGPGIAEELREQIFERGVTTKAMSGGTGHGLWSARRYAELNGGRLEISATGPDGTTFTLWLPRADLE